MLITSYCCWSVGVYLPFTNRIASARFHSRTGVKTTAQWLAMPRSGVQSS